MQYPEVALPMTIKTVCRVPGQIEVLKSFQGKWRPRSSPIVTPVFWALLSLNRMPHRTRAIN